MSSRSLSEHIYRLRDLVAVLPSILVVVALVGFGFMNARAIMVKKEEKTIEVSLNKPEPPPPPPEPPKPEPPKPQEQPQPQQTPQPQPEPQPQPQPQPQATPAPVVPQTPAPVQPPVEPKPVPPPQPQPPVPHTPAPDVQGEYVVKVRAQLNAIKRYPTGREASQLRPQGKVKVWFVLKRDGTMVDSGIDESSNSSLLDDAARKTLNRASFPAFPEQAWGGEATHKFTSELEFLPPG